MWQPLVQKVRCFVPDRPFPYRPHSGAVRRLPLLGPLHEEAPVRARSERPRQSERKDRGVHARPGALRAPGLPTVTAALGRGEEDTRRGAAPKERGAGARPSLARRREPNPAALQIPQSGSSGRAASARPSLARRREPNPAALQMPQSGSSGRAAPPRGHLSLAAGSQILQRFRCRGADRAAERPRRAAISRSPPPRARSSCSASDAAERVEWPSGPAARPSLARRREPNPPALQMPRSGSSGRAAPPRGHISLAAGSQILQRFRCRGAGRVAERPARGDISLAAPGR